MRRFIPVVLPFFLAAPAYAWLVVEAGQMPEPRQAVLFHPIFPEDREIMRESRARAVKQAYQVCRHLPTSKVMECVRGKLKPHYGPL